MILILLALLYVIIPWDFDFIPFFGRIDDLVIFLLALNHYRRRRRMLEELKRAGKPGDRSGKETGEKDRPAAAGGEEAGPYATLGVAAGDDEETVRKAYRDLVGKYHPDRVQHLGEEFREMAARRTKDINLSWNRIKEERGFT